MNLLCLKLFLVFLWVFVIIFCEQKPCPICSVIFVILTYCSYTVARGCVLYPLPMAYPIKCPFYFSALLCRRVDCRWHGRGWPSWSGGWSGRCFLGCENCERRCWWWRRPGCCWSWISIVVWRLIIITVLLVVSKKQEIFIFLVCVCVRLETFVSFHSIVPLIFSRIRKQWRRLSLDPGSLRWSWPGTSSTSSSRQRVSKLGLELGKVLLKPGLTLSVQSYNILAKLVTFTLKTSKVGFMPVLTWLQVTIGGENVKARINTCLREKLFKGEKKVISIARETLLKLLYWNISEEGYPLTWWRLVLVPAVNVWEAGSKLEKVLVVKVCWGLPQIGVKRTATIHVIITVGCEIFEM